MPQLNITAQIFVPFHIMTKTRNYKAFCSRHYLRELGIQLDFQNYFIEGKITSLCNHLIVKYKLSRIVKMEEIHLRGSRKS